MASDLRANLGKFSEKHSLVDKANTAVIVSSSLAIAILVFGIFAAKSIASLIGYQNSVLGLRNDANQQLIDNIEATNELLASYTVFSEAPESVIGTTDNNSKIVLDALPSKYDFPAVVTSLEGIIKASGLAIDSIEGSDDEENAVQSTVSPTPLELAFNITAVGTYENVEKLISNLARSIRPFSVNSVEITSEEDDILEVSLSVVTYYQPEKELGIEEKTVQPDGTFKKPKTTSSSTTGGTKK